MKLGTSWMPTAAGTPEIWKSAIVDKPATAGTPSIAKPQATAGTSARNNSANIRNKGTPAIAVMTEQLNLQERKCLQQYDTKQNLILLSLRLS
jgi:hypothetical protein